MLLLSLAICAKYAFRTGSMRFSMAAAIIIVVRSGSGSLSDCTISPASDIEVSCRKSSANLICFLRRPPSK